MVSNEFRNMMRLAASPRPENLDMCIQMLIGKVLDARVHGMDKSNVPNIVCSALSVMALQGVIACVDFRVDVRFEAEHEILTRVVWPRNDGSMPKWLRTSAKYAGRDGNLLWDLGRWKSPEHDVQVMRKAVLAMRQWWLDELLTHFPPVERYDLEVSFG